MEWLIMWALQNLIIFIQFYFLGRCGVIQIGYYVEVC